uniref:Uncharacterized protein n=1 Tax=Glossina palpalis gambiensis TaxID=67801 RepID=A0A1B0BUE8_9MUSC
MLFVVDVCTLSYYCFSIKEKEIETSIAKTIIYRITLRKYLEEHYLKFQFKYQSEKLLRLIAHRSRSLKGLIEPFYLLWVMKLKHGIIEYAEN